MFIDSWYLATVRRATLMFCSASIAASLLSLNGFFGSSSAVSFLMRARIAEDDPKNPRLIKTVRGTGYSFAADVTAN